jgi:DNA helicase-2/ATP-dependent DNA helicase PcrA
MERHGLQPQVMGFNNNHEEIEEIRNRIESFLNSGHHTLGIICKTGSQSQFIFDELNMPDFTFTDG